MLAKLFHPLDDFLALEHLTEDDMFSVKMRSRLESDEKLGPVRVLARVGHRKQEWLRVLQVEVFVGKGLAPD